MNVAAQFRDLGVSLSGHVATVEIRRPPHNYFDNALIRAIAEAFDALDADPQCRTVVLAAEGKSFCAGADFSKRLDIAAASDVGNGEAKHLYKEGTRLFRSGAGSAWRSLPIFASPVRKRGSPPISTAWRSTRASG